MRVRFVYSKRGGACFVPHIALAQLFSRTAMRAGLKLIMTQGFSPRAKISFAPELPAGVVALAEVVEMFFDEAKQENLIQLMNKNLPEGFCISQAIYPEEDAPSLGKFCRYAEYLIRHTNGLDLKCYFDDSNASILRLERVDGWIKFIVKDPAQNPIGSFVKDMIKKTLIAGWQDVNIVRVAIGNEYDEALGSVKMS